MVHFLIVYNTRAAECLVAGHQVDEIVGRGVVKEFHWLDPCSD